MWRKIRVINLSTLCAKIDCDLTEICGQVLSVCMIFMWARPPKAMPQKIETNRLSECAPTPYSCKTKTLRWISLLVFRFYPLKSTIHNLPSSLTALTKHGRHLFYNINKQTHKRTGTGISVTSPPSTGMLMSFKTV